MVRPFQLFVLLPSLAEIYSLRGIAWKALRLTPYPQPSNWQFNYSSIDSYYRELVREYHRWDSLLALAEKLLQEESDDHDDDTNDASDLSKADASEATVSAAAYKEARGEEGKKRKFNNLSMIIHVF